MTEPRDQNADFDPKDGDDEEPGGGRRARAIELLTRPLRGLFERGNGSGGDEDE